MGGTGCKPLTLSGGPGGFACVSSDLAAFVQRPIQPECVGNPRRLAADGSNNGYGCREGEIGSSCPNFVPGSQRQQYASDSLGHVSIGILGARKL